MGKTVGLVAGSEAEPAVPARPDRPAPARRPSVIFLIVAAGTAAFSLTNAVAMLRASWGREGAGTARADGSRSPVRRGKPCP